VAQCRHQLAKQYLRQPVLSIQQIAIELGFEEQSSFQKAFKHWQGCSPGLYRQRCSQHTHALPAKGAPSASLQVTYGTN
jgi:AraC-like DNA-binding protein